MILIKLFFKILENLDEDFLLILKERKMLEEEDFEEAKELAKKIAMDQEERNKFNLELFQALHEKIEKKGERDGNDLEIK
ncbi:hypothetical protein [Sulfurospirillum cavolei]|uniref:hypothetical protein n=1 Tax=Sulfurospirillum cavolei TaxID=366522 RepID=UPI000764C7BE|nr:hypothetical protein [Sulfurospirillum cavolei]